MRDDIYGIIVCNLSPEKDSAVRTAFPTPKEPPRFSNAILAKFLSDTVTHIYNPRTQELERKECRVLDYIGLNNKTLYKTTKQNLNKLK